jgi:hypothetical protein
VSTNGSISVSGFCRDGSLQSAWVIEDLDCLEKTLGSVNDAVDQGNMQGGK